MYKLCFEHDTLVTWEPDSMWTIEIDGPRCKAWCSYTSDEGETWFYEFYFNRGWKTMERTVSSKFGTWAQEYSCGEKHGLAMDDDGEYRTSLGRYVNGCRRGRWRSKFKDEDGVYMSEGMMVPDSTVSFESTITIVEDEMTGDFFEIQTGVEVCSVRHGEWIVYDPEGIQTATIIYDRGIVVEQVGDLPFSVEYEFEQQ